MSKYPMTIPFILIGIMLISGCNNTTPPETAVNVTTNISPETAVNTANTEESIPTDDVTAPNATNTPLPPPDTTVSIPAESTAPVTIKGEVWADNWFAFYLGENLVQEDSVPITTERSFNAETFAFDATYPLTLNFVVKDFKENDTGLEYIGSNRQQMGDGGLIAQFTNASSGELIAVTAADWKCIVIHEAPLDKSCENEANPVAGQGSCDFTTSEEPDGWKDVAFDDSSWNKASVYTEAQVSPKDGYDQIQWNSTAQLIWGPDLETNNTLLCRLTVTAPNTTAAPTN